jgi:hypothetical protein
MKKMEITQADVFYAQALELLLSEGHLKIHDLDRDDLVKTVKTLEWVKHFAQKAQVAFNSVEPAPLAPPVVKKRGTK